MRSVIAAVILASAVSVGAQPASSQFDVVSIKRRAENEPGMGVRSEPNGTTTMTNVPMALALTRALPVPLRDIAGMPDWVNSGRERYDIVVKPPEGSTRASAEEQRAMWRALLEERMKLAFHIEQRERDVYTLALARADGKLGPELKPSTIDCKSVGPPSVNRQLPGIEFFQQRCGIGGTPSTMASGGITLDQLALFLANIVSAAVDNRTGLGGMYAFTLTFSRQRGVGPAINSGAEDLPDVFTAVQEQLGLKLQCGKKTLPVYVIDHIERPSEN